MTLAEPIPLFVFPPLAAVDATSQACQIQHDGLHETLLLPAESSDRFLAEKIHYFRGALSASSLNELLVPALRHIAIATAMASRLYLAYTLPHHALQRLYALMAERVLANRSRDLTWNDRGLEEHLDQARRHLDRLCQRIIQPAATLHALDLVRTDGADAANYLAFAYYKKLSPVEDTF